MKTCCHIAVFTVLVTLAAAHGEQRMRVTADSVNMRAKPSPEVETVQPQLNEGDIVVVKDVIGEWAEIKPPQNAEFYVYGEFVKDRVIQVSKLRVRSGPSINYKEVGMVNKGDLVTVLGSFGEWIKIAPPPDSSLWVSTQYLEDPAIPKQKLEESAPPAPPAEREPGARSAPAKPPAESEVKPEIRQPPAVAQPPKPVVRKVKPAELPRPAAPRDARPPEQLVDYVPDDLDLIPLEGQGAPAEMQGILRSSGLTLFSRAPARFRLVVIRGNGFQTICYIKGNERQLDALIGRTLKIQGRQFWVRGEDVPVIVPSRITPAGSGIMQP
jgi:uncharacterized protein YgiM (DUF1202 family)